MTFRCDCLGCPIQIGLYINQIEPMKSMKNRRQLLLASSATALATLNAAVLSGCGGSGDASVPLSDVELDNQMAAKLAAQLGNAATAEALLPYIKDMGFTWSLPTIAAAQINTIVAYGFGNRPNAASGNTSSAGGNQAALPDPGPTNEALADAVYRIYQLKPVKIFAQWEIARFLVSKYNMVSPNMISIEPIIAADGTITYLSTDGVAAAVVTQQGSAAALGNVGVVGHRDHAKRCIVTSANRGMKAYAVAEVALPTAYDLQSGQSWTRQRDLYLVHDMYAQFAVKTGSLIAQAYPQG
jgi:hypothetical protein